MAKKMNVPKAGKKFKKGQSLTYSIRAGHVVTLGFDQGDTMPDLDLAMLSNITMPTLVVCGDEDRDNGSAEELASLIGTADFVEVPGTHMGSVTKPDLGIAIAEWLAQHK